MARITTAKAAQMADVSKRTIQNNIKTGKLSAIRDDDGSYLIEISEFLRAYPDASLREESGEIARNNDATDYKAKYLVLENENKILKEQIEFLKEKLEKSEEKELKTLDALNNTTRLLEFSGSKRRSIFSIFKK